MRHVWMIVLCVGWLGCTESHPRPGGDAVAILDGGACRPGDVPTFGCPLVEYAPHVCGDVSSPPVCVDGAWQCSPSMTGECWCSGQVVHGPACTCTPSGWSCPPDADAGVDAGASACETAVEGEPCAPDGLHCSSGCTDPCSFCNSYTCTAGVWERLEAFPDPTCEGTFGCGPTERCDRHTEYCDHVLSDVGGVPDGYACRPIPASCATADCACFDTTTCTNDGDGGVVVTSGGA